MTPYILKWDNPDKEQIGHLYEKEGQTIQQSIATVWASTAAQRKRFELFIENANFVWSKLEGITNESS